jgi:hypothetical protein
LVQVENVNTLETAAAHESARMKIESGRNVGSASTTRRADAAAAPGFSPEAEAAPRAGAPKSVGAVAPLDAVLALQAEEPPAQRRARQAKRGRAALDALEELERGLVSGRAPAALRTELERLRRTSEPSGEPGLDDILREIDTRLAVELAKLDRLVQAA